MTVGVPTSPTAADTDHPADSCSTSRLLLLAAALLPHHSLPEPVFGSDLHHVLCEAARGLDAGHDSRAHRLADEAEASFTVYLTRSGHALPGHEAGGGLRAWLHGRHRDAVVRHLQRAGCYYRLLHAATVL